MLILAVCAESALCMPYPQDQQGSDLAFTRRAPLCGWAGCAELAMHLVVTTLVGLHL